MKLIDPKMVKVNMNTQGTLLFFNQKESIAETGEYILRGGITFPKIIDGELKGGIVVVGKHLKSGVCYVFDECIYQTMIPISVEYEHAVRFFNNAFSKYFCSAYVYCDIWEHRRKYMREIIDCTLCEPKPIFIEQDFGGKDDTAVMNLLLEKESLGKLKYRGDSELFSELTRLNADKEHKGFYPLVNALKCVMWQIDKY